MNEAIEESESGPPNELEIIEGIKFEEIILEEKRLGTENKEYLTKDAEQVQIKKDENSLFEGKGEEGQDKEMNKIRCKTLMHLLQRSRMYATELSNQIKSERMNTMRRKISGSRRSESSRRQSKNVNTFSKMESGEEKDIVEDAEENFDHVEIDFFKKTRLTRQGFEVSHYQPVLVEGGVMRDYQLSGVQWMTTLFSSGVNGILADEMGLGKSLQVIALICNLIEKGMRGPFLIIAPLSTLGNWIGEFRKFAPSVPTLFFHGNKKERKDLIPAIMETVTVSGRDVLKVVITSYEVIISEKRALSKINWLHITVDEGHRMKNHNSMLSRTLRDFKSVGKLLITGTPLQNDLSELWSLLNFIIPEVFNSLEVFQSWFDVQQLESDGVKFMEENYNINIITTIQQILMPFLLRREKKDVSIKLPPKKEVLVYCPMSAMQKKLYEATLDRSIEYLLKPKRVSEEISLMEPLPKRACVLYKSIMSPRNDESYAVDIEKYRQKYCYVEEREGEFDINIQLRNPQMLLRKIVNHPYLVQFPLIPGTSELKIDEDFVKNSGKLLVVDAMLSKLKARGHKVIIFSTFKTMLDILEDLAHLRLYTYFRMDGSSKLEDRQESISEFNMNPEIFLFLISMRAGGLGINLTGADTIIIYDSDWNPHINLQSQDRCHRIGQTKPVVIYKLCVRGTVDERIIERGNAKRKLEKMIIQKGKFTKGILNCDNPHLNLVDLQELKNLLLSTDYDSVIHSNGWVFTDEELEALLDRSEMSSETSDTKSEKANKSGKIFKLIKCDMGQ